ncbi:hypothetical protein ACFVXK_36625, partial [Streptomyces sp. NPDC058157]
MDTPLPPAHELALIDAELARLDARRLQLLARRDWLLRLLWQSGGVRPAPGAGAFGPAGAPGPEASKRGAQNVLLVLGAVLLAVAALAFTLVSWGSLGIGGRSAVLAAVTAAALAAPVALLRRRLRSTAEAVAAVALALTVLDAYALHAVGLPGSAGPAYAAWAAAVLAGLWAGYGAVLRGLRSAPLAAVGAAQLPLPLAAAAAGADLTGAGWALLATAALDAVLAVAVARRAVRVPAWVGSGVLGGAALAAGLAGSLVEPGAAGPALLLAAGALLGVAVARREPRAAAAAVAGGLAAVSAVGALVPAGWDGVWWAVAVRVAAGLALVAAVRGDALAGAVRRGLALAGAGVAALGASAGLAVVAWLLSARLAGPAEIWSGTAERPQGPGAGLALTLLLAAAALALLTRLGAAAAVPGAAGPGGTRRGVAGLSGRVGRGGVVVCAWAGVFAVAAGLPGVVGLGVELVVALAVGAVALRAGELAVGRAAGGCVGAGAFGVSLAALDGRAATLAVFGLLGAGAALGAAYGGARAAARGVCAVASVGYAAALVVALGALGGVPVSWQ